MPHFTPTFQKFVKDLSANNSTQWFNDNRKTYEKEVKQPFNLFVHEMINRIQTHEPEIQIKPADAIMRINKDIRFSKDKIPYNTYVAANISPYGKKDKGYPGFYFQFSPEKIVVVGGSYVFEPDALKRVRTYIAEHPKEFSKAYNNPEFKKYFKKIQGEANKRIPEEFQEAAGKEPLIANKQFYYMAELDASLLQKEKLADELMKYYLAGKEMNGFLRAALTS
jgi:uncharacterized protein (TIGR02453 family)